MPTKTKIIKMLQRLMQLSEECEPVDGEEERREIFKVILFLRDNQIWIKKSSKK